MHKNEKLFLKIQNYGCNAEGVSFFNDEIVFIPYSLVDEQLDATIIKANKKFNLAKIDNIREKSPLRITPPCPYFAKCGGCQLQHTQYENSLKIKTQIVQKALSGIGKLDAKVLPCKPSEKQYHYRNKLALPINPKTRKLGMYRANSHNIVDIESCPLQTDNMNRLIRIFDRFLQLSTDTIFDDKTKKGLLKSLVARDVANTILVTVVINGNDLPSKNILQELLERNFENVGLSLNINKLCNNVILTENFKHIFGKESAKMNEFGIEYQINNQSFLQVNDDVKAEIYGKIFDEVKDSVVIDAYSGAGLLSAMIAKHAKKVFGIEIVAPATDLANKLAKQNKIENLKNINGDCATELPNLLAKLDGIDKQNLTIVLDPPRKGCAQNVLDAILGVLPNKIVYLSCEPSTLARDLRILCDGDKYSVKLVQPYDMFPQTKHVETFVVLTKNEF